MGSGNVTPRFHRLLIAAHRLAPRRRAAALGAALRRAVGPDPARSTRSRTRRTSITSLPTARPMRPARPRTQPTTLESAIARVVTGDAIVLRGGRLPHRRTPAQPGDHAAAVRGRAADPEGHAGGRRPGRPCATTCGRRPGSTLFPARPLGWWQRDREGMRTPLHRFNNDMVFVDGRMLQSAGWEGEVDEHSYYIDYDKGQVYIGVDPTITAGGDHRVRQRARRARASRCTARRTIARGRRSAGSPSRSTPTARSRSRARGSSRRPTNRPTSRSAWPIPPRSARRWSARCSRT